MSGASGLRKHGHTAAGDGGALGAAAPSSLTVPGATSPAQTAEGSAVWDTDDDRLTIGTGAGRKTLVNQGDAVSLLGAAAADVSMGTHKITNLGTPSAGTDAATKDYADSVGGGGGADPGIQALSTDSVQMKTGRIYIYDQSAGAVITLDGNIALESDGFGIDITPSAGKVVTIGGDGMVMAHAGADPTATDNGQVVYRTDTDALRARVNAHWMTLGWIAASGSSTVASGTTSIVVTHGAGFDPVDARGVSVWPTNNPTNDPGWFWVSAIGSTTFTINVRNDPGSGGAIFAWRVVPR